MVTVDRRDSAPSRGESAVCARDAARRQALRERIARRYDIVCEPVSIGDFRMDFTRIADPDNMARHMPGESHPQAAPQWQPYWAAHWDGAWAVAHALLDEPLSERKVLDLGCGLGLTGAVAAARGARVWMADAAPPALLLARLNTWPWRDRVRTRRLDWRVDRFANLRFDLIVGADIIYDSEDWPYLERFWAEHLAADGQVLLGESGRRTGELFPDWLAARGWQVQRSAIQVPQCPRPQRLIWCEPGFKRMQSEPVTRSIVMNVAQSVGNGREAALDRLLTMIERHVDLDHCREVDQRYRATLACEPVDHPPLVVRPPFATRLQLPVPWDAFALYPHREAYHDPVAMMQNQLLGSVVPGLLLEDDHPLLIRADHGTVQIASLLGARWEQADDNPPWVHSLGSPEAVAAVAEARTPLDLENGGVLARSFAALRLFHSKLAAYPRARQAIQIVMPDLQGPLDTADQIWGCGMFAAFYEEPQLVDRLLGRIVEVMLQVAEKFRVFATDRLDPAANAQHAWQVPGRLLIRNDSAIMLSPQMYAEQVRPHDQRLLQAVGGGSQHFCGNGQHLIAPMLDTQGMKGFDFGQPWLMDEDRIYAQTMARRVPFTNHRPPREELLNGHARRRFPTGVVFTYEPSDYDDARQVVETFRKT